MAGRKVNGYRAGVEFGGSDRFVVGGPPSRPVVLPLPLPGVICSNKTKVNAGVQPPGMMLEEMEDQGRAYPVGRTHRVLYLRVFRLRNPGKEMVKEKHRTIRSVGSTPLMEFRRLTAGKKRRWEAAQRARAIIH